MRRTLAALGVLAAAALPAGAASASGGAVSVDVGRARIATGIGHDFQFRSTIANHGAAPATGLIAHLNVLSLTTGTYVDPEDWSSRRTRYLAPLPPGGSTTVTWHMQAVNSGSFGVYVAVLPRSGAHRPPVTGQTIRVDVGRRQTLDAGGILPLALGIPAFLGLLGVGLRVRRSART